MKRIPLYLLLTLCLVAPALAESLNKEQREASIRYVQSLRNTDGGFRSTAAPGASSVGATSSSLRALKYLGGERVGDIGPFIRSCIDETNGGLADTPGGTAEVRATAVGVMAVVESLGEFPEQFHQPILDYFAKNAKSLPDIYIAAAALDAAKIKTPSAPEWIAAYEATRNADGNYGKTPADTAGAVITTLRLGGTLKDRETVAKALKAVQRPDGGFSATGEASDMATVYRMARALRMVNEKPDVARMREFVARCRNADGGYGPMPGKPSTVGTTYFASIVLHWADEMDK